MSQVRVEKQTAAVQQQAAPSKQKKAAAKVAVAPEQVKYANLLLYCSWAGIAILAVTFALYLSGIAGSFIPPSQMPQYWGMSAHELLETTGAPSGWGWLTLINHGDFMNLIGIAFLALLTIVGYLTLLLPAYIKKKDIPYTAIVVAEILVLSLAASGILKVGGH